MLGSSSISTKIQHSHSSWLSTQWSVALEQYNWLVGNIWIHYQCGRQNMNTIKPAIVATCIEGTPAYKGHHFQVPKYHFICEWTCIERPPAHNSHFWLVPWVAFIDRFYCIIILRLFSSHIVLNIWHQLPTLNHKLCIWVWLSNKCESELKVSF